MSTKIKFEIKNRFTGKILFMYEKENNTFRDTILQAIREGANLRNANLSDADLSGANLRNADLSGANLSDADLRNANLRGANLRNADLRNANLSDANLSDADLRNAKDDLFSILALTENEIPALREKLMTGGVNGSCYEGECCCLVGTLANVRKCNYREIEGLEPNPHRPAERWFLAIRPGHTPENSKIVKITVEWIDEYLSKITANA